MAFSGNDHIKMRVKRENLLLFSHKHTKKSPNIIRRFVNPLAKKVKTKRTSPLHFSQLNTLFSYCVIFSTNKEESGRQITKCLT